MEWSQIKQKIAGSFKRISYASNVQDIYGRLPTEAKLSEDFRG